MRVSWNSGKWWQRVAVSLAIVLALAATLRVITERAFLAQAGIEGAFATLTPDSSEGTVTMTGRYLPAPYGFSEEKLLLHFAEQIGLVVDGEIREVSYEGRVEHVYEKLAAQAHSLIKVVYLTDKEEYYLCVEITLSGKNTVALTGFREALLHVAKQLKLEETTTALELCGIYHGEIPLAEKDDLTDKLLRELYAQPVYENRENANYTVYAYTGAVEEYLVVGKKKVNVQVAIYYDRNEDCTEVVLASPLGLR
ncbi:MAG: YwmB family TATA-box binding protein [Lachnospiraceae bacterium]|nr:YwmB family TATA-box binding protein [Lachnospiraceae bacterium]